MSAVRLVVIRCDSAADCGNQTHTPFETSRAADVRAFRKGDGWQQRPGGRDICPACWAADHR